MPLRRVDIIAVLDNGTGGPAIEHLKGWGRWRGTADVRSRWWG